MLLTRIWFLDLRMKLDAAGFYDEFEVNRVVEVELNPKSKQKRSGRRAGAGRFAARS